METGASRPHKETDGFHYEDYIAPDGPETLVGKLVSTEQWHKGIRFALICNLQAVDGRRIVLFTFQKHTGFYGPRDGAVNFKHMEKNTFQECETRKTRTECCTWMGARQIIGPKTDAV